MCVKLLFVVFHAVSAGPSDRAPRYLPFHVHVACAASIPAADVHARAREREAALINPLGAGFRYENAACE